jgi:hypothetical protein
MTSFHSLRRDFLRAGGIGIASVAIPAVSFAAEAEYSNSATYHVTTVFWCMTPSLE